MQANQAQANRARNRTLLLALVAAVVIAMLAGAVLLTQDDDDDDDPAQNDVQNSAEVTQDADAPQEAVDAVEVTLFMSYIPSVQFAPVYVAAERGYFAEEGIDISFENSFNEADGVERISSNNLQFGLISGDQVVLARAQDRSVVYVFEWYHNYPVAVAATADLDITTPADLAGHTVGLPNLSGASFIGLRALLAAADIEESDLEELRTIGFAAPEVMCERQIDAAVIYVANEPLTIEQQCGLDLNLIRVSDYATVVSNGLITNEQTIRDNPELVRGMVRAVQRGVADVLADPDAAFDIVVPEYVPDLPEDEYDTQRQVLQNSLELWDSDDLGRTDPAAWETTQAILLETGLQQNALDDLTACYDMSFLPE